MPYRTLRFCPQCMETQHAASRDRCRACDAELLMLLDDQGALRKEFLAARGACCTTGCRNCPYPTNPSPPSAGAPAAQCKTCGKCQRTFQCQSNGCWCEQLQLSDATLKWLQRAYADCLCPECLKEFATA